MNFFGHAAVASWRSAEPAIALGAMLPDFETMCGGRIARTDDATLAEGIALHHTTDGVFHKLPAATGLMSELDAALLEGGCARGPRRAVAHIGVELLLDGILVDDGRYRDAYLAALAYEPAVTWREPDDAPRFATLFARLRTHGVPDDLRRPEAIASRLQRVLGHRPLLAPSPHDSEVIRQALVAFRPRVEVAADTVLRGLRAALT